MNLLMILSASIIFGYYDHSGWEFWVTAIVGLTFGVFVRQIT